MLQEIVLCVSKLMPVLLFATEEAMLVCLIAELATARIVPMEVLRMQIVLVPARSHGN